MNVTLHTIGSFATAAAISSLSSERKNISSLVKNTTGFVLGILVHGILDFLPHNYPLPSKIDVILALILLILVIFAVQKQNRIILLFCFVGAIFPDVIDLSAGIINKHLGIPVPMLSHKIFPWHRKEFSGSIYDGSQNVESAIYHVVFLSACFILIYIWREKFLNLRKIN